MSVCDYSSTAARRLLLRLHAEQIQLYGFADHPDDTPATAYHPPNGLFVALHLGEQLIGCGGWRRIDATTAEIKRMYVKPEHRGCGHGRHLLAYLERHAIGRGVTVMRLETGRNNDRALWLYTSAGYQPIPPYITGRDPRINRALRRPLP